MRKLSAFFLVGVGLWVFIIVFIMMCTKMTCYDSDGNCGLGLYHFQNIVAMCISILCIIWGFRVFSGHLNSKQLLVGSAILILVITLFGLF